MSWEQITKNYGAEWDKMPIGDRLGAVDQFYSSGDVTTADYFSARSMVYDDEERDASGDGREAMIAKVNNLRLADMGVAGGGKIAIPVEGGESPALFSRTKEGWNVTYGGANKQYDGVYENFGEIEKDLGVKLQLPQNNDERAEALRRGWQVFGEDGYEDNQEPLDMFARGVATTINARTQEEYVKGQAMREVANNELLFNKLNRTGMVGETVLDGAPESMKEAARLRDEAAAVINEVKAKAEAGTAGQEDIRKLYEARGKYTQALTQVGGGLEKENEYKRKLFPLFQTFQEEDALVADRDVWAPSASKGDEKLIVKNKAFPDMPLKEYDLLREDAKKTYEWRDDKEIARRLSNGQLVLNPNVTVSPEKFEKKLESVRILPSESNYDPTDPMREDIGEVDDASAMTEFEKAKMRKLYADMREQDEPQRLAAVSDLPEWEKFSEANTDKPLNERLDEFYKNQPNDAPWYRGVGVGLYSGLAGVRSDYAKTWAGVTGNAKLLEELNSVDEAIGAYARGKQLVGDANKLTTQVAQVTAQSGIPLIAETMLFRGAGKLAGASVETATKTAQAAAVVGSARQSYAGTLGSSYAQFYKDAQLLGYDEEGARQYAMGKAQGEGLRSAAVTGVITAIGSTTGFEKLLAGGGGKRPIGELIDGIRKGGTAKDVVVGMATSVKNLAKQGMLDIPEEVADEALQAAREMEWNPTMTTEDALDQIGLAAIAAPAMATSVGAFTLPMDVASYTKQRRNLRVAVKKMDKLSAEPLTRQVDERVSQMATTKYEAQGVEQKPDGKWMLRDPYFSDKEFVTQEGAERYDAERYKHRFFDAVLESVEGTEAESGINEQIVLAETLLDNVADASGIPRNWVYSRMAITGKGESVAKQELEATRSNVARLEQELDAIAKASGIDTSSPEVVSLSEEAAVEKPSEAAAPEQQESLPVDTAAPSQEPEGAANPQQDGGVVQGHIFADSGAASIDMRKAANPSTLIHEVAHALDILTLDDGSSLMDVLLGDQKDTFRSWVDGEVARRGLPDAGIDRYEVVAEGMEKYLSTGDVPSGVDVGVGAAFQRVGNLIKKVYEKAAKLNIRLSPEATSGYEAMFAQNRDQFREAALKESDSEETGVLSREAQAVATAKASLGTIALEQRRGEERALTPDEAAKEAADQLKGQLGALFSPEQKGAIDDYANIILRPIIESYGTGDKDLRKAAYEAMIRQIRNDGLDITSSPKLEYVWGRAKSLTEIAAIERNLSDRLVASLPENLPQTSKGDLSRRESEATKAWLKGVDDNLGALAKASGLEWGGLKVSPSQGTSVSIKAASDQLGRQIATRIMEDIATSVTPAAIIESLEVWAKKLGTTTSDRAMRRARTGIVKLRSEAKQLTDADVATQAMGIVEVMASEAAASSAIGSPPAERDSEADRAYRVAVGNHIEKSLADESGYSAGRISDIVAAVNKDSIKAGDVARLNKSILRAIESTRNYRLQETGRLQRKEARAIARSKKKLAKVQATLDRVRAESRSRRERNAAVGNARRKGRLAAKRAKQGRVGGAIGKVDMEALHAMFKQLGNMPVNYLTDSELQEVNDILGLLTQSEPVLGTYASLDAMMETVALMADRAQGRADAEAAKRVSDPVKEKEEEKEQRRQAAVIALLEAIDAYDLKEAGWHSLTAFNIKKATVVDVSAMTEGQLNALTQSLSNFQNLGLPAKRLVSFAEKVATRELYDQAYADMEISISKYMKGVKQKNGEWFVDKLRLGAAGLVAGNASQVARKFASTQRQWLDGMLGMNNTIERIWSPIGMGNNMAMTETAQDMDTVEAALMDIQDSDKVVANETDAMRQGIREASLRSDSNFFTAWVEKLASLLTQREIRREVAQFIVSAYLKQRMHESNPDHYGKDINVLVEEMKQVEKMQGVGATSQMSNEEVQYKHIAWSVLKQATGAQTKSGLDESKLSADSIWAVLTKEQRNLVEVHDGIVSKYTPKSVAAHYQDPTVSNAFKLFSNFTPDNAFSIRASPNGESKLERADDQTNVTFKSKRGENKVKQVQIKSWDLSASLADYMQSTAQAYYVQPHFRKMHAFLTRMQEHYAEKTNIPEALRRQLNTNITELRKSMDTRAGTLKAYVSSYHSTSAIINTLMNKAVSAATLSSLRRILPELGGNLMNAPTYLMSEGMSVADSTAGTKSYWSNDQEWTALMVRLGSQIPMRAGRYHEVSASLDVAQGKSQKAIMRIIHGNQHGRRFKPTAPGKGVLLNNRFSQVGDALSEFTLTTADTAITKPLWVSDFMRRFRDAYGRDFDLNDPFSGGKVSLEQLQIIAGQVDTVINKAVNASSASEQAPITFRRAETSEVSSNLFNMLRGFLTSFISNRNKAFWDASRQLANNGSRMSGATKMVGFMLENIVYVKMMMGITAMFRYGIGLAALNMFGQEDEDEQARRALLDQEFKESFDQYLNFTSSDFWTDAASLGLGGLLQASMMKGSNWYNSIVATGFEMGNKVVTENILNRRYNWYEDSLMQGFARPFVSQGFREALPDSDRAVKEGLAQLALGSVNSAVMSPIVDTIVDAREGEWATAGFRLVAALANAPLLKDLDIALDSFSNGVPRPVQETMSRLEWRDKSAAERYALDQKSWAKYANDIEDPERLANANRNWRKFNFMRGDMHDEENVLTNGAAEDVAEKVEDRWEKMNDKEKERWRDDAWAQQEYMRQTGDKVFGSLVNQDGSPSKLYKELVARGIRP